MNFRQLRYFAAVAEEENIGRAALRLHISQPPLTRQIQQLEDELGVKLLHRTSKGVELTQAGDTLYHEARNILALTAVATERTVKAEQGHLGRLDIAIFGSAILGLIPKTVLEFRNAYPDVNVVLHTMSKPDQIKALRRRQIDIGFNRLLAPHEDITTEVILYEELVIAVNENHPLAKKKDLKFTDLAGEPLILFPSNARPGFIDYAIRICNDAGFSPNITQEVGDAVTGVALVASGFGISIVPRSTTALSLPGVIYRDFEQNKDVAGLDLSCIYRTDNHSQILHNFLQVVRRYAAELEKKS
ncbi:LysR substrate-binding domain-containing protein [Ponticaulis sp.]|uniref:LysR substrate-binding domain-containing protein n=1 Tax=Ponticaulis sp. TaxID=2020902 RepID=UPI000B6763A8|nr:LysR substrate-binding domain-containing protein [Ponticaulis sp.]MAI91228.1 LysR family transcriptional regulator [Ponticaulis sp.]OUX98541.1 MAG: LysR family transcriptional regulator [Hyphomonadaceae bacterium TMED5]